MIYKGKNVVQSGLMKSFKYPITLYINVLFSYCCGNLTIIFNGDKSIFALNIS